MARDSKSFGQRLRELRKSRGMSQSTLAELVKVSLKTVQRWELEQRQPRMDEVLSLARALHISPDELLNPESSNDWVLTIKTADSFEEVINLTRNNFDCIAQLTTTKQGAGLLLTGSYEMFADNDKFKAFINQVKKARQIVLQNGEAMGWHNPKED